MDFKQSLTQFKEIPLKFKFLSLAGVLFPLLSMSLFLFGCGVESGFVDLMDSTNQDIQEAWERDVRNLPGMDKIKEEDRDSLIRDLMAPAKIQAEAIKRFKEKQDGSD